LVPEPLMKERRMLTDTERRLIFSWKKEGIQHKEIAKRLNIAKTTVTYVLKTYTEDNYFAKTHTRGRKRILSAIEIVSMIDKVEENRRLSANKLAVQVQKDMNKSISLKTIKRYLRFNGFKACKPKKVPLTKEINKKLRLKFAKEYIVKPKKFWEKVIWSDETKINLFCSDGYTLVWRKKGEVYEDKCTVKTVKYNGGKINLWGCVSSQGVGILEKIDGNMDAAKYVEILQNNLLASAEKMGLENDFIFQQDNDSKHKSKLASNYFSENLINVMKWPSYSPDLNVIEHIWAYVKKKYNQDPAKNRSEIFEKIQKIWSEIPSTFTKKLVDSIYKRLSEVIRKRGGVTRY
jgi:transposase